MLRARGNAYDCEGDFDWDLDADGAAAAQFKAAFGRRASKRPCINPYPCNSDFTCDGDVDVSDAAKFKSDFGRALHPISPVRTVCQRNPDAFILKQ